MEFKTLNYIHDLIAKDVKTREDAINTLRKMIADAEDKESPNVAALKMIKDKLLPQLWTAQSALTEFEEHEWR